MFHAHHFLNACEESSSSDDDEDPNQGDGGLLIGAPDRVKDRKPLGGAVDRQEGRQVASPGGAQHGDNKVIDPNDLEGAKERVKALHLGAKEGLHTRWAGGANTRAKN